MSDHYVSPPSTTENSWFVYIVQCADDSLYTGVTTDIKRRLKEHNETKKGAKYTRNRRPVNLVYSEKMKSRSAACSREYAIKKMAPLQKKGLIESAQMPD